MKLQKLLSYTRKACETFSMINEGDCVAVAISGGKDSLAMLLALNAMRRFYPRAYELRAVTVSLGFPGDDFSPVRSLCSELGVPFSLVETDIGNIVFNIRKESNPCALCSNMRKGALNAEAKRLGCNVVALGHNKDDLCQSFLMSLFYEGRIHTFAPVTHLDRIDLRAIRPLMFAPEDEIADFVKDNSVAVVKSGCPANGETKREVMKRFIYEQENNFDNFREKIFTAIINSSISGYN